MDAPRTWNVIPNMFQFVERNLVYLISCMDILAVSIIMPVFPKHLRSLGLSNVNICLLDSIYSGVQFFSSPIIGHLSDRFSSKRVFLASLLLCSLCYPIMGLVTSLVSLIIVRCVIGFAKHSQLLSEKHIEEYSDVNVQLSGIGKLRAFTSLGFIVGPVIGGYIIDRENGFLYMSFLTGLIFALNAFSVRFLRQPAVVGKRSKETNLNFVNSFKSIPWFICWDLFLLKCLTVFAVFAFYINYSLSVSKRYQVSSVVIGYSYSLQGMIRSFTAFEIRRVYSSFPVNFSVKDRMKLVYVIVIVCLLSLYFSPNFYWFVLCLMPLNVCLSFIRIVTYEALILRIKDYNKGIILGAFNNVTAVARFLLPLVSGYAVDRLGYDGVYAISIVSLLIGIVVMSVRSPDAKAKAE